jgi:hemoglobin-like flavoprotein
MSIENAKAFYAKVINDKELFNKIAQMQQSNPEGLANEIVKLASEQKYLPWKK